MTIIRKVKKVQGQKVVLPLAFLTVAVCFIVVNRQVDSDYYVRRAVSAVPSLGPVCYQNPYVDALVEPMDAIGQKASEWLQRINIVREQAQDDRYKANNHEKFFPFEQMASCKRESKTCIGGTCREDTSKIVCGAEKLETGCIIYSIGGNNQWEFELDALAKTPCQVHTFDCTGPLSRYNVPKHERLHFHHVCVNEKHVEAPTGPCEHPLQICGEMWTMLEMQRRLSHARIDMLKTDIEGFEWALFNSWPEIANDPERSEELLLPMQIMVEIHAFNSMPASQIVELQAHLLKMGYVVAERDDNKYCPECTELTLIRAGCPRRGVYSKKAGW